MKLILLLHVLLFVGCAHRTTSPSWVNGLRTGEISFKISQGKKIFFRRLAQGSDRDFACESAYRMIKRDMSNEWPKHEKIAHTLEVMYFDENFSDCAVTVSVEIPVKPLSLSRAELAEKFAISGFTEHAFMRQTGEKRVNMDFGGPCKKAYTYVGTTYHDSTIVCWSWTGFVLGYCNKLGCFEKYE